MMDVMLPQAVRFGILGAARIAPQALIKPARLSGSATVDAIAARAQERAQAFAKRHDLARAYGSYDALLADTKIDAVYICLPNSAHAEWSVRALEAGKHVLCEKPLASNAEQAEGIDRAAQESGHVFMEAFHNRYHPLVRRMREVVVGGELGDVQHTRAVFRTPMLRRTDIRYNYALGGGVTMDMGCYLVNLLRFVLDGEPQVVAARADLMGAQVDRRMRADLRFAGTIDAQIDCEMRALRFPQILCEVTGTKGSMQVINPVLPQFYHRMLVRTGAGTRKEHFGRVSTYRGQMEAFVAALRSGASPPTDAADGVLTMRVIDDIYRAAGLQPRGLS